MNRSLTARNLKQGFTLIELLVVISIIALLSSIVFSALSTARKKARDAARLANANQIVRALELYSSNSPSYIPAGAGIASTTALGGYVSKNSIDDVNYSTKSILAVLHEGGAYSADKILDPIYGKDNYYLGTCADANSYAVFLKMEQSNLQMSTSTLQKYCGGDAASTLGFNYAVSSAPPANALLAASSASTSTLLASVGDSWTRRGTPFSVSSDGRSSNISFSNNKFIAFDENGAGVRMSSDGVSWQYNTIPYEDAWAPAVYGNGAWVTVGNSGYEKMNSISPAHEVLRSSDGLNWSGVATGLSNSGWTSVAFGNVNGGTFVAVANAGQDNDGQHLAMTSHDGITWTQQLVTTTSSMTNQWSKVIYAKGLFIAIASSCDGDTAHCVMTSPDGITWTPQSTGASIVWIDIASDGTNIVAISMSPVAQNIMTSTNGTTWSLQAGPTDPSGLWRIATSGGKFVAISQIGATAYSSATGTSWTSTAMPLPSTLQRTGIAFGSGKFVSVAKNMNGRNGDVGATLTSPDGLSWTKQSGSGQLQLLSVAYGEPNGSPLFVALSGIGNGKQILTSPDAVNWTAQSVPVDYSWTSVAYGNGRFVAVGDGLGASPGNQVMTSTDGINWVVRPCPNGYWWSITYGAPHGSPMFVAVSDSCSSSADCIMTSPDGVTWNNSMSLPVTDAQLYGVAYGEVAGSPLFVAISGTGSRLGTLSSSDGVSWSYHSNASFNNIWAITFGSGKFVAVDANGNQNYGIHWSTDGVTWNDTSPGPGHWNSWESVAYGDGIFVAVSGDASTDNSAVSTDGVVWQSKQTPDGAIDKAGWSSIAFGNHRFVAVSDSGRDKRVMTTP